jgi:hypothetical protein
MKKFITMGILALAVAAISTQEAPAWLNWKFGLGMNLGWQSGGNNTLWGLFRNGQPPAPDTCGGGFGYPGGLPGGGLPPGGPLPVPQAPHGFYPNSSEHGVSGADSSAATIPARTQSYGSTPWAAQSVNYQYPYQYPYYGYYSNYGYYGR